MTKYSSDRLTLGPGEYFTECTLYDNGQSSQYLGHIHLATNKGQTFESGVSTKYGDEFDLFDMGTASKMTIDVNQLMLSTSEAEFWQACKFPMAGTKMLS